MVLGVEIVLLTHQNERDSNQDYASGFLYSDNRLWVPPFQTLGERVFNQPLVRMDSTLSSDYLYLAGAFLGDGFGKEGEKCSKGMSDFFLELVNQNQPPTLNPLDRFNTRCHSRYRSLGIKEGGTTSSLLLIANNGKAMVGNMGDSRIYLKRGEEIYLLNRDHNQMLEYITSKEKCAITDPVEFDKQDREDYSLGIKGENGDTKLLSSVLTRSVNGVDKNTLERKMYEVGRLEGYDSHLESLVIVPGDDFVLMSDGAARAFQGMTGVFRRRYLLAEILQSHSSLHNAAEEILNLDYPYTHDNKTVVILRVTNNGNEKRG